MNIKKTQARNYRHRCFDQLLNWVAGKSIHNKTDNECCPDFSCCKPQLLASKEEREKYLAAYKSKNHAETSGLLAGFLGKGLALNGYNSQTSDGRKFKAK